MVGSRYQRIYPARVSARLRSGDRALVGTGPSTGGRQRTHGSQWHARSDNYSTFTRKAVFLGYTYRWIAIRDENDGIWATDWAGQLSPVQRQLLGGLRPGDGDHAWGHSPATTPLYGWLKERDLLDPGYPPLRP